MIKFDVWSSEILDRQLGLFKDTYETCRANPAVVIYILDNRIIKDEKLCGRYRY